MNIITIHQIEKNQEIVIQKEIVINFFLNSQDFLEQKMKILYINQKGQENLKDNMILLLANIAIKNMFQINLRPIFKIVNQRKKDLAKYMIYQSQKRSRQ